MKRSSIFLLIAIFIVMSFGLMACSDQAQYTPTSTESAATLPPTETSTPVPTETQTPVPSATATATPAPTAALEVRYAGNSHVYLQSSAVTLSLNVTEGDFYATATSSSEQLFYTCQFETSQLNYLDCIGGNAPLDTKLDFKLFRKDTNEMVFEKIVTFARFTATPEGMVCEAEPQWNSNGLPAHMLGTGCFAVSCWQNGNFFWGFNDTCEKQWPFEWEFPHPLATFMPTTG